MHKEDLALNNLQWLICDKTQPDQTVTSGLLQVIFVLVVSNLKEFQNEHLFNPWR